MPIFFTELLLHAAGANDLAVLQDELARQSFREVASFHQHAPGLVSIHFKRKAKSIYEVTGPVIKAVKKTGKKYSFTIKKEK